MIRKQYVCTLGPSLSLKQAEKDQSNSTMCDTNVPSSSEKSEMHLQRYSNSSDSLVPMKLTLSLPDTSMWTAMLWSWLPGIQ